MHARPPHQHRTTPARCRRKHASYKELAQRVERHAALDRLAQRMEAEKAVMTGRGHKRKVAKGSAAAPAQFRWKRERRK